MNDDFEKLATHPKYSVTLKEYLAHRLRGLTDARTMADVLAGLSTKRLNTVSALTELANAVKPSTPGSADAARSAARIRDIAPMLDTIVKPTTYLDIGCGNGAITAAIGAHLGLAKDAIIGADVANWAGHAHATETSSAITFRTIERPGVLPAADASIDIVTAFMVLHHIEEAALAATFTEISRILRPGGYVIIREHDSPNHMIDSLINIEHALFEVAIEKLTPAADFGAHYYGKYKPTRDWLAAFAAFGFDLVGEPTADHRGTRPFYAMFRSRASQGVLSTPELLARAANAAVSSACLANARSNTDIQKMIARGQRADVCITPITRKARKPKPTAAKV